MNSCAFGVGVLYIHSCVTSSRIHGIVRWGRRNDRGRMGIGNRLVQAALVNAYILIVDNIVTRAGLFLDEIDQEDAWLCACDII